MRKKIFDPFLRKWVSSCRNSALAGKNRGKWLGYHKLKFPGHYSTTTEEAEKDGKMLEVRMGVPKDSVVSEPNSTASSRNEKQGSKEKGKEKAFVPSFAPMPLFQDHNESTYKRVVKFKPGMESDKHDKKIFGLIFHMVNVAFLNDPESKFNVGADADFKETNATNNHKDDDNGINASLESGKAVETLAFPPTPSGGNRYTLKILPNWVTNVGSVYYMRTNLARPHSVEDLAKHLERYRSVAPQENPVVAPFRWQNQHWYLDASLRDALEVNKKKLKKMQDDVGQGDVDKTQKRGEVLCKALDSAEDWAPGMFEYEESWSPEEKMGCCILSISIPAAVVFGIIFCYLGLVLMTRGRTSNKAEALADASPKKFGSKKRAAKSRKDANGSLSSNSTNSDTDSDDADARLFHQKAGAGCSNISSNTGSRNTGSSNSSSSTSSSNSEEDPHENTKRSSDTSSSYSSLSSSTDSYSYSTDSATKCFGVCENDDSATRCFGVFNKDDAKNADGSDGFSPTPAFNIIIIILLLVLLSIGSIIIGGLACCSCGCFSDGYSCGCFNDNDIDDSVEWDSLMEITNSGKNPVSIPVNHLVVCDSHVTDIKYVDAQLEQNVDINYGLPSKPIFSSVYINYGELLGNGGCIRLGVAKRITQEMNSKVNNNSSSDERNEFVNSVKIKFITHHKEFEKKESDVFEAGHDTALVLRYINSFFDAYFGMNRQENPVVPGESNTKPTSESNSYYSRVKSRIPYQGVYLSGSIVRNALMDRKVRGNNVLKEPKPKPYFCGKMEKVLAADPLHYFENYQNVQHSLALEDVKGDIGKSLEFITAFYETGMKDTDKEGLWVPRHKGFYGITPIDKELTASFQGIEVSLKRSLNNKSSLNNKKLQKLVHIKKLVAMIEGASVLYPHLQLYNKITADDTPGPNNLSICITIDTINAHDDTDAKSSKFRHRVDSKTRKRLDNFFEHLMHSIPDRKKEQNPSDLDPSEDFRPPVRPLIIRQFNTDPADARLVYGTAEEKEVIERRKDNGGHTTALFLMKDVVLGGRGPKSSSDPKDDNTDAKNRKTYGGNSFEELQAELESQLDSYWEKGSNGSSTGQELPHSAQSSKKFHVPYAVYHWDSNRGLRVIYGSKEQVRDAILEVLDAVAFEFSLSTWCFAPLAVPTREDIEKYPKQEVIDDITRGEVCWTR